MKHILLVLMTMIICPCAFAGQLFYGSWTGGFYPNPHDPEFNNKIRNDIAISARGQAMSECQLIFSDCRIVLERQTTGTHENIPHGVFAINSSAIAYGSVIKSGMDINLK